MGLGLYVFDYVGAAGLKYIQNQGIPFLGVFLLTGRLTQDWAIVLRGLQIVLMELKRMVGGYSVQRAVSHSPQAKLFFQRACRS